MLKNPSLIILFLFLSPAIHSMDNFIMMPFNTFDESGQLVEQSKLWNWLTDIQERGFTGITVDFWWGIIEPAPKEYNFHPFLQLIKQVKTKGLKLKVILSFHACGNTIGDQCNFPLPKWVLESGNHFFYQDQNGKINYEYISIFADDLELKDGRAVLQVYEDLITEFDQQFKVFYEEVIVNIELGVGPAGQLHYPSYSYPNGFCGVGFFQWYGDLATSKFHQFLDTISIVDSPKRLNIFKQLPSPTLSNLTHKPYQEYFFADLNIEEKRCKINSGDKVDCGYPDIKMEECSRKKCCWAEVHGDPYCYYHREVYNFRADLGLIHMHWYQEEQLKHLQKVVTIGRSIMKFGIPLSVKLPCIHWFVNSASRAAERTSGFMINQNDMFETKVKCSITFLMKAAWIRNRRHVHLNYEGEFRALVQFSRRQILRKLRRDDHLHEGHQHLLRNLQNFKPPSFKSSFLLCRTQKRRSKPSLLARA